MRKVACRRHRKAAGDITEEAAPVGQLEVVTWQVRRRPLWRWLASRPRRPVTCSTVERADEVVAAEAEGGEVQGDTGLVEDVEGGLEAQEEAAPPLAPPLPRILNLHFIAYLTLAHYFAIVARKGGKVLRILRYLVCNGPSLPAGNWFKY